MKQLNLFADINKTPLCQQEKLVMDKDTLMQWKSRIFQYQQSVREGTPAIQTTLFEPASVSFDPHSLDPLSLQVRSLSFWRYPANSPGKACLYFVIDSTMPLLLYIGETGKSNQRWKGVHDCKRYIEKYQELHYYYGLDRAVNIAFWFEAPVPRKPRQQMEKRLIQLWRSPFNKECWQYWGQPFGKI